MAGIFHGGGIAAAAARYGGRAEDWLDLSTGINPEMVGLPEVPTRVWNRLPDRELDLAAREAARDWYLGLTGGGDTVPPSALPGVSASSGEIHQRLDGHPAAMSVTARSTVRGDAAVLHRISPLEGEMPVRAEGGEPRAPALPLAVPGTQALIQVLPRLAPIGRPVAVLAPTYGEYAHCFRRAGFTVEEICDLDEVRPDHGVLIVVNPNNPTGRILRQDELVALGERMRAQGARLHVDEAFGDSRGELTIAGYAAATEGITASRSFGKFFGLAGLRLGFVFAVPETLEAIASELGPWPVSGPALYIASTLFRSDMTDFARRIDRRAAALEAVLGKAGLEVVGGTNLFKLVRHPRAQDLYEHLARSHILVRRFDYAGDWLRVGLTPDQEGDWRLAHALAAAAAKD